MINRFVLNEVSYFGPGAREVLPQEIKRLGLHKAFVATDKDLIKFGVADKVLKVLENAGIPYEIFSEIKPNPTVSNVKAGVEAFAKSGADFILAIGGGSSIDTSKAIGIITNNPDFSDVVSLEGVAPTRKKSVPIIALPTTAGTAAEVTINYVITDEENHKKMVCVDPNDIPAIAIVDAELMYTLPKGLTASTGLDALTHAIEGLITKGAWEMSDMFEIKAIEMIARYLETAVFEPTNAEARNGMAVAQYIAGMAFSNVGLGVVHGMAHPLGAIFDIPHGVANALLLPVIMEFNAPAALSKYVDIAKAMNVYKDGMSREEAAKAAVEAVKALSVKVGIPQHLSELGIKEEDLPRLAASAIFHLFVFGLKCAVRFFAAENNKLKIMKKKFILTVAFLSISLFAQQMWAMPFYPVRDKKENVKTDASSAKVETWEFYSTVETPSSEELAALVSNHKLGKKVAFLYDSFKDTYVVKEEVVPGDPTRRTVIRKPEIYNAVRTIEKELNRQVRKDLLPQDKAEQEFTGVLKVALAAIDSDTESFETALQENKKDVSHLLGVFRRVSLKSIY